jgi:hypothetical protein
MTMWTDPEKARPIFEPYVNYLQSAIEGALNAQLMPQLENGEAKFRFRQVNIEDAFTKAKTDMIYLSEGVLSPGEVREERGLDPEGVVELDMETSEDVKASPLREVRTPMYLVEKIQIKKKKVQERKIGVTNPPQMQREIENDVRQV